MKTETNLQQVVKRTFKGTFVCTICAIPFRDAQEHLQNVVQFSYLKRAHEKRVETIRFGSETRCFCGGHVQRYGTADPDSPHWQIVCEACSYIFDED